MSDDVPLGFLIGLLVFLLSCSAFFSGSETALMTLNRYRLRHKAKTGHRGAQLADRLLSRPDRLLGVILIGNNLVNIIAAQLVGFLALRLGGPVWVAISGFVLTLAILIFAEVAPKTLAALQPERLALPASFVFYPLLKLLRPVVWLINGVANGLLYLFGVRPDEREADHLTIEELRTLVSESGALLPKRRHQMLMYILELQDITVDDIMIPHNEIVGIDLTESWDRILATIRLSRHTRLPVYRDSIDDVVGILHLRRLVQNGNLERLDRESLERLVEAAYFVPEGTPLNRQLVQFQRSHQRTAFVVDEYGDIQGLVTLEDILEEIIGELDGKPEPAHQDVRPDQDSDGFVVNAAANVRALNRMMNWHLPTDGPKTLNGLILEQLETIPEKGTGLMLDDYPIEILQTNNNVVKTVLVHVPAATEQRVVNG